MHFHPVQKPQVRNTSPRAHFCRFLQHASIPTRRKVSMIARLLPATLSTYLHGCHTCGKPPMHPLCWKKCHQGEERSAHSQISSSQDFSFSCLAFTLLSSLVIQQSPCECAEEGVSPAHVGWTPLYLKVGTAKEINADRHKQGCIFKQQQQICDFQNERWKKLLIKNTSRPKSVWKGSFSLAITLEEHNAQSPKPQDVTSDVGYHSSFVPITSWPNRDKAQLGPSTHAEQLHLPKMQAHNQVWWVPGKTQTVRQGLPPCYLVVGVASHVCFWTASHMWYY